MLNELVFGWEECVSAFQWKLMELLSFFIYLHLLREAWSEHNNNRHFAYIFTQAHCQFRVRSTLCCDFPSVSLLLCNLNHTSSNPKPFIHPIHSFMVCVWAKQSPFHCYYLVCSVCGLILSSFDSMAKQTKTNNIIPALLSSHDIISIGWMWYIVVVRIFEANVMG